MVPPKLLNAESNPSIPNIRFTITVHFCPLNEPLARNIDNTAKAINITPITKPRLANILKIPVDAAETATSPDVTCTEFMNPDIKLCKNKNPIAPKKANMVAMMSTTPNAVPSHGRFILNC